MSFHKQFIYITIKIISIMEKYEVRVRYTFEGTYKVVAEDRDEAERIVTEDCGLVLGGNSTLPAMMTR